MATVEVASSVSALQEKDVTEELDNTKETTTEEVVTPLASDTIAEEPKEEVTEVAPFELAPVSPTLEVETPAEPDTKEKANVEVEEAVVEDAKEETQEVTQETPVVVETKEASESNEVADVPVVEETTDKEEKPVEAEEEKASTEAPAEKTDE